MISEEISKFFRFDEIDFYQCNSYEEYNSKLLKQVDEFLFDNCFIKEEILFFVFNSYCSVKLLENNENLEILKKIFKNNEILRYCKKNKFGVMELILIITAFDKSTEYYICTIKNEEKNQEKKIEEIYEKYTNFINSTEDIDCFKIWYKNEIEFLNVNLLTLLNMKLKNNDYQRKICENVILNNKSIEVFSDFETVFSKYIQNLYYSMINKKEFRDNERNLKENKFIRDLYNMFNSLTDNMVSYKFISELVSTIYNKQMSESQIKKSYVMVA